MVYSDLTTGLLGVVPAALLWQFLLLAAMYAWNLAACGFVQILNDQLPDSLFTSFLHVLFVL